MKKLTMMAMTAVLAVGSLTVAVARPQDAPKKDGKTEPKKQDGGKKDSKAPKKDEKK